jgi:hypothetical protein
LRLLPVPVQRVQGRGCVGGAAVLVEHLPERQDRAATGQLLLHEPVRQHAAGGHRQVQAVVRLDVHEAMAEPAPVFGDAAVLGAEHVDRVLGVLEGG